MHNKKLKITASILFVSSLFLGWGNVGHKIINYNTILTAYPTINFWNTWVDSLRAHASDADNRKQNDPTEGPKHYIDIDNYPEFIANKKISQSFDSLVALHGYNFVMDQGILPWAIINTVDSLTIAFSNNDLHKAMLITADLGHYVGDACMPLHITRNYNGQYSGQSGVHSRYESNMIGTYSSQISYSGDSLSYIENVSEFTFQMIYQNYVYVDSVLKCDSIAKAFTGSTSSSAYYAKLWELSKGFTTQLFKTASKNLSCLVYTALINAGNPTSINLNDLFESPDEFSLFQNFPNPFNPVTKIRYSLNSDQFVSLKVFDVLGNEIITLVDEEKHAGIYDVEFPPTGINLKYNLSSGIYFYRIQTNNKSQTRKMIILR